MTRNAELEELLASLFPDAQAFRSWLYGNPRTCSFLAHLPPLAATFAEAVQPLEANGLVPEVLEAILGDDSFRRRHVSIQHVAGLWGLTPRPHEADIQVLIDSAFREIPQLRLHALQVFQKRGLGVIGPVPVRQGLLFEAEPGHDLGVVEAAQTAKALEDELLAVLHGLLMNIVPRQQIINNGAVSQQINIAGNATVNLGQGSFMPSTDPSSSPSQHPHVDVGILTMKEEEFEAVLDQLGDTEVVQPKRRAYEVATLNTAKGPCVVAVTRCAKQGNTFAQSAVNEMVEDLSPAFLLVVGIAGATPTEDFTLGDVVVSSHVHDLSLEDTGTGGERRFNAQGGPLHPKAEALVENLKATERRMKGWQDLITLERPTFDGDFGTDDDDWNRSIQKAFDWHVSSGRTRPKVTAQAIAASDRLVKDPCYLVQWKSVLKGVSAVEMESAGVLVASRRKGIPFLAIRGISDVVGWKRSEHWTLYACHSAAAFAKAFLMSGVLPPQ